MIATKIFTTDATEPFLVYAPPHPKAHCATIGARGSGGAAEAVFSRWLCDGALDCGRSRFRGPCCGGARAFHLEGLSHVLYST